MHAGLRLSAVPLDLASVGSSEVFESKLPLSVPERCATTQTGELPILVRRHFCAHNLVRRFPAWALELGGLGHGAS